ncbi:MAG: hypothetical protein KGN35_02495 [Betaproteobacteria bacterium]|nr:hypothetical protein [Betaproteobacteria bacterium]
MKSPQTISTACSLPAGLLGLSTIDQEVNMFLLLVIKTRQRRQEFTGRLQ